MSTSTNNGYATAINFSAVPEELQKLNQWVLWKTVVRSGTATKMPWSTCGTAASTTDPSTWTSYDNAVSTFDETQHSGIGFVFTSSDPFTGIDLDGCRDPATGTVADWAVDEVLRFSSYTEVSPSQTGLKIWITADNQLPKGRNKKLRVPEIVAKVPGVEVYSNGRYFAVTGAVYKQYRHIAKRETELQEFLQKYWPTAPAITAPQHEWRSDDAVVERARKYVAHMPGAVSGSGGHSQTFSVACRLVKGFGLTQDQAFEVLKDYNSTCDPPWSEHELMHKLEDAAKASGAAGYLRDAKPERWESIRVPEHRRTKASQEKTTSTGIDFEIIDSKTFAETDYSTTFLIDGIMTAGQPQLYGGPSKSLKTSVLVDQGISLAAGVPFLGRFNVSEAKRVLLLSSESGCSTLKETALRICDAKGIRLDELGDCLHWGFRPPMLTDAEHIATLAGFVIKHKIDVLGIDPAYLSMNLQGNEASSQFSVGAVLQNLTTLQADTGCTPILAAHFRMHMLPGVMPSLEHIAGAGFGQWARQWVLLNRREAFSDENPGSHKLLFAFGGSAGHCGAYGLDIEEGYIQAGRVWKVSVSKLSEIREQRQADADDRRRTQEQRTHENHRVAILRVLKRFKDGESMSSVRDLTGISGRYFRPVWEDLISSQEIEPCEFSKGKPKKDGTIKTYPGCRIVNPDSRLYPKDSDTSDTLGHTRTLSDSVRPA